MPAPPPQLSWFLSGQLPKAVISYYATDDHYLSGISSDALCFPNHPCLNWSTRSGMPNAHYPCLSSQQQAEPHPWHLVRRRRCPQQHCWRCSVLTASWKINLIHIHGNGTKRSFNGDQQHPNTSCLVLHLVCGSYEMFPVASWQRPQPFSKHRWSNRPVRHGHVAAAPFLGPQCDGEGNPQDALGQFRCQALAPPAAVMKITFRCGNSYSKQATPTTTPA